MEKIMFSALVKGSYWRYTSESAFSNAFKRVTGSAPQRHRTAARAAAT
jgi:AraC-like DNA-binding protein